MGPHRVNGHNFYDAVNKLVQRSAFDPGFHLHTVRHTTASRLWLSALSDSVDYDRITPQFPWLAGCLSSPAEMDVLLGGEGQSGHGLQAVAALMGHSHPLTTLRHYIHTAGIAFYARLCGRPVPNLMRAFEFRLGSSRTMQRWIRAWRDAIHGMDSAAAEGFIQLEVLAEAETLCPGVVNAEEQARASTAVDPPDEARAPEIPVHDADAISYERLARMEEILRDEATNDAGLDIPKIEHALARIYAIPTGKHGSSKRRHPHEEVDDRCLPKPRLRCVRGSSNCASRIETCSTGLCSVGCMPANWSSGESGSVPETMTAGDACRRRQWLRRSWRRRCSSANRAQGGRAERSGGDGSGAGTRPTVSFDAMSWPCAGSLRGAAYCSQDPVKSDRVGSARVTSVADPKQSFDRLLIKRRRSRFGACVPSAP